MYLDHLVDFWIVYFDCAFLGAKTFLVENFVNLDLILKLFAFS